jgi:site-specific DNA-cytosine methylase
MRPLRVLDLFSGLHSWTKNLRFADVLSIDNNEDYEEHTSIIGDILKLNSDVVLEWFDGFYPDVIVASPPCTTFSIASCGHNWGGGFRAYVPKTEEAKIGLLLLKKTLELIKECSNDNTLYFIENPRGLMRKMDEMCELKRHTIWYCQYGETDGILRAKPTDIWTNSPNWVPRPVCRNHSFKDGVKVSTHCNHVSARRGAKTGTQGLKNNAVRSEIPAELCEEIMNSVYDYYYEKNTKEEKEIKGEI